MIEMRKGYKVGDTLLYYRRVGTFKNMKAPCEVVLQSIDYNVIGSNHKVVDVEARMIIYSHEINLRRGDQYEKVMGAYYKDLIATPNNLPRKTRKQINKFFNKYPEYSI